MRDYFKFIALIAFFLIVMGLVSGCATTGPVHVSESMQRAQWKTQHCGLGVSSDECESLWQKARTP